MRYITMSGLLVLLLLTPMRIASGQSPASDHPEYTNIVGLIPFDRSGHGSFPATGFVVSSEGRVLTAAHVVYRLAQAPTHYRLAVIWVNFQGEREYFVGTVVCSQLLPYDPEKGGPVSAYTKDLAVVQIEPVPLTPVLFWPRWPLEISLPLPGGLRYSYVAHTDALPAFAPLRLAHYNPHVGERIHVPGYSQISPIPGLFTGKGSVEQTFTGADGSPLFGMFYSNPPRPGASGSPVIDDSDGTVVGLLAWGAKSPGEDQTRGGGVSNAALHHPCGGETF
jgi:V8-like Glu-specific endopeptidase